MLRVAILCEFSTTNGGERSMLAALDRLRTSVTPLFLAPSGGPLQDAIRQAGWMHVEFSVRDAAGERRPSTVVDSELLQLVRSIDPDLLHANSLSMGRLSGRLTDQLTCPCTAHLRDILRLNRGTVDDLNRNVRMFAVSQTTRTFHLGQGLHPERTIVLHNGVDTNEFHPAADESERSRLCTELELASDAVIALAIGQIGMRKGLDVLVEAAGRIAAHCPALHFVMIGERYSGKPEAVEYEQALRSAIHEQRLDHCFHWLGFRNDVSSLLRGADLLIHPARQEPFGRVLLEAAASGLPIVATNVGGTAEILTDGESARLVPPGASDQLSAAVIELVADSRMRSALGSNARRRTLQLFGSDRSAAGLLRHWQEVVSKL